MDTTRTEPRLPGADSATWRHFALLPGFFVAGTGLLLQVAHPVVGAGVLHHSNFKQNPWKRALRTHISTMRFVYGMQGGPHAEGARLREVHRSIKGVDGAGRRYHALHPDAYAWVHLTLAQYVADTARWFYRPLSEAEAEQMWQEFREIGKALRLKDHQMPATWSDAQRWFWEVVERELEANQSTADVLESLSRPPKPARWIPSPLWQLLMRPLARLVLMTTAATLPAPLRERLGLRWSSTDQRRFERFAALVRAAMRVLPEPLRYAPLAYVAMLRDRRSKAPRTPSSVAQNSWKRYRTPGRSRSWRVR